MWTFSTPSIREDLMASRTHSEAMHVVDTTNRMGLKAPGILTFLLSFVIVLAAKYFSAAIPGLSSDTTQFAGLLFAYFILVLGCLLRAL
jgi:heme/copper-type cytochrome/quinol oxidase subunit 3